MTGMGFGGAPTPPAQYADGVEEKTKYHGRRRGVVPGEGESTGEEQGLPTPPGDPGFLNKLALSLSMRAGEREDGKG